jgi:hypothetical protein
MPVYYRNLLGSKYLSLTQTKHGIFSILRSNNTMKNTAKKERCKDCEMMSEYFESRFITVDVVAYALGVSTKTIERWQSREKDPLPLDIRGGKGRPSLYHIARICEWGLRQAVRKAGYTVYPLL